MHSVDGCKTYRNTFVFFMFIVQVLELRSKENEMKYWSVQLFSHFVGCFLAVFAPRKMNKDC